MASAKPSVTPRTQDSPVKLLTALFFGLFAPLTANAGTLAVAMAPGPGVDFTSIQDAIDASQDGDIISVTGTFHERLHIDGKSITIVGHAFAKNNLLEDTPGVGPIVLLENLSAGQEFRIINLSFGNYGGPGGDSIVVDNCDGRVGLESMSTLTDRGNGMRITDSPNVVLVNVHTVASRAYTDAAGLYLPANGLIVEAGSSVEAFSSTFLGSSYPPFPPTHVLPVPGGDAAIVRDSILHMNDCKFVAGDGGSELVGTCLVGAEGGSAVTIEHHGGSLPSVNMLGGEVFRGLPGSFDPGCASAPSAAHTIDDPTGAFTTIPGTPRVFYLGSPVSASGYFDYQIYGKPGDLWFCFVSPFSISATPLPGIVGSLLIDPATAFQPISGNLQHAGKTSKVVPFANPGFPVIFHTQVLLIDLQGGLWLTGPGTFVSL